jgi:hypothetical protein
MSWQWIDHYTLFHRTTYITVLSPPQQQKKTLEFLLTSMVSNEAILWLPVQISLIADLLK